MDYYSLDDLLSQSKPKITIDNNKIVCQPSNSTCFRDVHTYDGKLTTPSFNILKFSNSDKTVLASKIISMLKDERSKRMAFIIMNETNDFDNANGFNTSDVFATLLSRKLTADIVGLLEEQLVDMLMLGPCPQGRSTRLLQILELTI